VPFFGTQFNYRNIRTRGNINVAKYDAKLLSRRKLRIVRVAATVSIPESTRISGRLCDEL